MTTVTNVIARSNVISGVQDDSYSAPGGSMGVQTAEVVMVAADVHDLDSAPVVLLERPASGRGYVVLGVYSHKAADAYGGGSAVTVNYQNGANTLVATIPLNHFIATGTDSRWATPAALSGTPAAQSVLGSGIDMNATVAFTGAGGDVTVTVQYVEVDR